ncbi:glycoside hydrolase family 28 protein [Paraglaciecola sp. 25GB23A]|uniref:glycoside hydrolase family 28 protein n=1 Tax=Paraglaciecola sp. 25GB23A TaxID=3156068 RepID=UPI0032AECD24
MQRRIFLKSTLSLCVLAALPSCSLQYKKVQTAGAFSLSEFENDITQLRNSIVPTVFPKRDFEVKRFGALGDKLFDNTMAFKQAIEACHLAGGGRVIVPAGQFLTGPIHLKSNVNFHLADGATLFFIPEPERYLPAVLTRWEGVELMGYSPLIYAYKQENIAITGNGTIHGGADDNTWWPWKGPNKEAHWQIISDQDQKAARDQLFTDAESGVPVKDRVYAEGAYLRPPMIQTYQCKKVLIEGVTLTQSPFWLINPVLCADVIVRNVTCRSHGPNNDGCDPESCNRVLIEDCTFDTGDDCIALKSGRNADGRRINAPIQNVLVSRCKMKDGHGGLVIGSEISGGARNIYLDNCQMSSPELERAIRIKTNSVRGGLIENIYVNNVEVGQVKDAIVINFYYEEGDAGQFDPQVRNININNLRVDNASRALFIKGFERAPIVGLHLSNCHFNNVKKPHVVEHVKQLTLDDVFVGDMPLLAKDLVSL